jgi:anti-anti-sigma regulatory factor
MTSAPRPLVLPAALVVGQLAAFKALLVDGLRVDGPARLDGAAVTEVDTAGLQLLVAFVRDARAAGRDVAWVHPAPAVTALARTLGLSGALAVEGGAS